MMLVGTMQEEAVPAVKARGTDFSIAAIMARGAQQPPVSRYTLPPIRLPSVDSPPSHHSLGKLISLKHLL